MGKDKLRKFRENLTFSCFVQPEFDEVFRCDHPLKGHWRTDFFHNDRPIILELGCGKGEYTVALAERDPQRNYIGIDIKGARMWRGAKTATERGMANVGFLRTRIEFINSLFAEGEIDELWITFPDPQLKTRRAKKRLTSPLFLEYYARLLRPDGMINLKTDSKHLYAYTNEEISFKRFLHISILKNTRTPLHDHVRKNKGWSDEQVVARWLILQCVASALLLLVVHG